MEDKVVKVSFVADEHVELIITSIKDRNNVKPGQDRQRSTRKKDTITAQNSEDLHEDDAEEASHNIEKSAVLNEEGDLPGHCMFGFQTPKRKGSLLVQRTPQSTGSKKCKSPRTPRTPKSTKKAPSDLPPKTPYNFRRRLKRKIAAAVRENGSSSESEVSDFSESESEYKASESEHDPEENEEEEDLGKKAPPREQNKKAKPEVLNTPRRTRRQKDIDYVPIAEEFFSSRGSSKVVTSDHTLSRLKGPRLAEDQLLKMVDDMSLSHRQASDNLYEDHVQLFDKWMHLLIRTAHSYASLVIIVDWFREQSTIDFLKPVYNNDKEGFSVLLYGLGSKRNLIQQFSSEMLQDPNHLIMEVNGFFPSLTIKEILDCIADVLEMENRPSGVMECLGEIEDDLDNNPGCHVFLLVHNLDGPMLRSDKSQDVISKLVRIDRIHLLASVDHINAPLIWDHAKLSRYNFLWWDVTTFRPYVGETQYESSLLVQRSGQLALSSLFHVFHSLTTNSCSIFLIIVRHQLANKNNSTYKGMHFRDLYWSAREALLVSSDLALRAHLQEFIDHQLVRQRRSTDSSELYHIPVDTSVLQYFVDVIDSKEE